MFMIRRETGELARFSGFLDGTETFVGRWVPGLLALIGGSRRAREAGWRVPAVLLCSGTGMAAGGWLAGLLYDRYGFYAPAFATGVAFNLLNLLVVGTLVLRQREHARAG